MQDNDGFKFVWLGHSSFLINFRGKTILYDPVFSSSVSPIYILGQRFQPTPVSLEELPPIDYIIISHDHYDHLDIESIRFFENSNTVFFTPLGVGSHLRSWGIEENRITELDWWEQAKVGELEFILTPAKHFSGRVGFDKNKTLWGSWVLQSDDQRFFFSGDSGYGEHFKKIGDKYGPFDLTFMENGQYNPMWTAVHMLPEHAIKAQRDLKSQRVVPMHWGMFVLSTHTWFDPVQSLTQEAKSFGIEVLSPKLGDIINVTPSLKVKNWWQGLIPKP
jgi:L-ascorbate metabolism protein UlaG (beta-lactamase superfamily)